jgi:hypothetical protein
VQGRRKGRRGKGRKGRKGRLTRVSLEAVALVQVDEHFLLRRLSEELLCLPISRGKVSSSRKEGEEARNAPERILQHTLLDPGIAHVEEPSINTRLSDLPCERFAFFEVGRGETGEGDNGEGRECFGFDVAGDDAFTETSSNDDHSLSSE